jgi:hypothetical protein
MELKVVMYMLYPTKQNNPREQLLKLKTAACKS